MFLFCLVALVRWCDCVGRLIGVFMTLTAKWKFFCESRKCKNDDTYEYFVGDFGVSVTKQLNSKHKTELFFPDARRRARACGREIWFSFAVLSSFMF